jgi:cell division protein FtsQ
VTRPSAPRRSGKATPQPSGATSSTTRATKAAVRAPERRPSTVRPAERPDAKRPPVGEGRTAERRPSDGPTRRRARTPKAPPTSDTYRRRRLAAVLVAVVLVVGAGFGIRVLLYDSGLANVQSVQVTGVATIKAADVLMAADVTTGVPLAGIDTSAIADRVAVLPAVATVSVGRNWPHTVAIAVTERVPVASVTTPKGVQLVDQGGVVYPGTAPPGLPKLGFGAVGPADLSTRAALTALAALPAAVRSQVQTVDATVTAGAPAQVTFGLTGDKQVLWGTSDRASEKAAVIVPLLTQPGSIYDVTSPDLPTIRR